MNFQVRVRVCIMGRPPGKLLFNLHDVELIIGPPRMSMQCPVLEFLQAVMYLTTIVK
jgi:hypothetical protein